jgi:hypothetical protein
VTVPIDHPLGEPAPFAIRVPGGVLEVHGHDFVSTRYPGLPPIDACPHDTDEYRAQARELGYGDDTAAMCREHETAHHLLAALLRLPCSPTMRGLALHAAGIGPLWPGWREEEAAVLALQAFARACGVDLVKLAVEAAEREEQR